MVSFMNDAEGKTLRDGSFRNRDHMTPGTACGCFYCAAVFAADEIREWVDADLTALCPRCGIDTVLPGVTDTATLHDLHEHAFSRSAAEWDAKSSTPRQLPATDQSPMPSNNAVVM
jgi:hypothetical protein